MLRKIDPYANRGIPGMRALNANLAKLERNACRLAMKSGVVLDEERLPLDRSQCCVSSRRGNAHVSDDNGSP